MIRRFAIHLVKLSPTLGSEIAKMRPCVVISPDEMNRQLRTVLVAPLTSTQKPYASRVSSRFAGKSGQIALDQIRTVDRVRLVRHLGDLDSATAAAVVRRLLELFA